MFAKNLRRGVVATTKSYLIPVRSNPTPIKYGLPGGYRFTQSIITQSSFLARTTTSNNSSSRAPSTRGYVREAQAQLEADTTSTRTQLKPYKSIPLAGLPFIGNLPYIIRHGFGSTHLNQIEMFKKHGPIFRVQLGPMEHLIISDPVLAEELIHQADWNPARGPVKPWMVYRDLRGVDYGLVTLDHEPWRKSRSVLSKRMLRPNELVQYMGKLNDTADEFIQRMIRLRDNGEGDIIPDLNNEFYKWAMESVAIVLFDVKLGCLEDPIPSEVQEFINAIDKMFSTLAPLFVLPMYFHTTFNTKVWKKHVESWDTIWNTAMKYINLKCESISKNGTNEENPEVDLLTYLLASKKLSMSEICGNFAELLLGGVDTTSNTLLWAMYRLSRAPDCQERLHRELVSVLNGAPINKNNIQQLPYLKAVIRETLRLYPVVPNNSRLPQKDISIAGYNIPKGTNVLLVTYVMSRNDDNFENANDFKPERWLRENNTENKSNVFASLPFGFGTRMCIGKRLAEMEIQMLLAKICQTFLLKPTEDKELVGNIRGLLIPEINVPVRFVTRDSDDN